ncbi:hypothetical protein OH491_03350 [Termitidicoccus mucosus]|uniref:Uncharacterized protein n=1 Tax=Termitidicoccus mucosus TaxID=1184151 RepID=A0A178ILK8_9BACT|nr:hypothetical protein AW736_06245 [Opitutaceae bacterium TSB47]
MKHPPSAGAPRILAPVTALAAFLLMLIAVATKPAAASGDGTVEFRPPNRDWFFDSGPDPATTGALEFSKKTILLTGDFTRGKRYVAAACVISRKFREANRMVFTVRTDQEVLMVLLTDSTGQVHMQKHPVKLNKPKEITVKFVAGKPFWDGAKDGVLHLPVKEVSVLVHSDEVDQRGFCEISDVRLLKPPASEPIVFENFDARKITIDGSTFVEPTERDWAFDRGPDPATTGTLEFSNKTILLTGDFTRGKRYVAAACAIRFREVNRMSFKVHTNQKKTLIVFITDVTGQIHLQRHPVKPNESQKITVGWTAGKSKEFRGGAKDGVLHLPVRKVSVLIDSAEVAGRGFCEISDVRLFNSPPSPPAT